MDFQIDKSFPIKLGTRKDGNQKFGNLNVYFWITNLLGTKNTVNVYRYTGDPQDDGYLADARGIQDKNNQLDPDSWVNYYTMNMQTPFNFARPRTIRLGLRFDF